MRCIEAINRNETVWYTPEILIPDGPSFGIFGLKGVILELENVNSIWKAISIKFDHVIEIKRPKLIEYNDESKIQIPVSFCSN
jgi:GLPGLI family protein